MAAAQEHHAHVAGGVGQGDLGGGDAVAGLDPDLADPPDHGGTVAAWSAAGAPVSCSVRLAIEAGLHKKHVKTRVNDS